MCASLLGSGLGWTNYDVSTYSSSYILRANLEAVLRFRFHCPDACCMAVLKMRRMSGAGSVCQLTNTASAVPDTYEHDAFGVGVATACEATPKRFEKLWNNKQEQSA